MDKLRFTIPEILALMGAVQCIYILVYVFFRSGSLRGIFLPVLYFLVMAIAFFMNFARGYIAEITPYYDVILWGVWAYIPALCALLVIQMVQIDRLPQAPFWGVLGLVPAAFIFSSVVVLYVEGKTCQSLVNCDYFREWLDISGAMAGALALLSIWGKKDLFTDLRSQKAGKERYWIILSLIVVNVCFLAASLLNLGGEGGLSERTMLLQATLGLAFLYLVTTSLFRIYPHVLLATQDRKKDDAALTQAEHDLAERIKGLLMLEKVYHEPSYSRSDLAQEIGVPESIISKVINVHFGKSFPQLLNERRVEDAKQLLLDTDAPVRVVAQEVGFNSLPSFNRVFKEIEGRSPSDYRKNMIK